MKPANVLLILTWRFVILSLISFGGANAVLPEMHRFVVQDYHWMTDQDFANIFAIAQASPGPNVLVVSLIGWHVARFWGALVATLAICLPAFVITFLVAKYSERVWSSSGKSQWKSAVRSGLMAMTAGLVAASAYLITLAAAHTVLQFALVIITVAVTLKARFNPLWLMLVAAVFGFVGWI